MKPFIETTCKGLPLMVSLLAGVIGGCGHFHDVSKTAQATIKGCTDQNIEGTAMLKRI